MFRANLSREGHERVLGAMQAAIGHVAEKKGLQYGVSGKHLDTALGFLDKHYENRHDLKPHEREFIKSTLEKHYGIESESA